MEERYSLNTTLCSLPAEDVDKLLSEADGCCALLYLYLLRHGNSSSRAEAALAIRRSETETDKAADRLRSLGLLSLGGGKLPPPDNEMPEYRAEDIVRRTSGDRRFKDLLAETERLMGHTLSSADLKTLFGVYDHLGLPPEVIMLLMNHCTEEYRSKYGPGRVPPMRTIEKEAYVWANREIVTLKGAEEHLKALRERRDVMTRIKRALGILDRELTPTERRYIDDWLDMGFSPEAIEMAFDRTVTNTGQLKWNYMNKIILSWDGKGLHTPEAIEKGDRPANTSRAVPSPRKEGELERMKKIYDKVRNGQG